MATITRLTSKLQTTIPVEVRRVLGLGAGYRVEFRVEEGGKVTLHTGPDHPSHLLLPVVPER